MRNNLLTPRWLGLAGLLAIPLVALMPKEWLAVMAGLIPALALLGLLGTLLWLAVASVLGPTRSTDRTKSVEDRLDELERINRRNLITPEEYSAKRQEILKDL